MAYEIKAETRAETGKGKVRKMRRSGSVPAVVYGHGDPSQMLTLNAHDFSRTLERIKGHSPIVDLDVGGKSTKCVIKTLQRNPTDGSLLHVDFQKVHPDEKVTINVPVIIHGTAEGVKEGGMMDHILREVPVRAKIASIPEHFDVDVTHLGLGHSVHIADLKVEDVEFALPLDSPIVTILVPRKLAAAQAERAEAVAAAEAAAAAPAAEEAAAGEPEVIKEKKAEEEGGDKKEKKEKGK
jgi:large subunit ribosomal protein L25